MEKGGLWEGYRESRRCSRDTYPESYITECILIHEEYRKGLLVLALIVSAPIIRTRPSYMVEVNF